jgi:predicted O-linked N-acetylglucosamine transferase (SPINDLY family)
VTDAVTARIRALADGWREIIGKPDAEVAEMIRQDQIDILVDLAGHTSDNRLPLFALRPAPVQMAWIGYPASTGLPAIDYRLTDAISDPPGVSDTLHTEKLLRIRGGGWAYLAPQAPPIGPFPAIANGFVTFGSFNNLPKITPRVLETWARILKNVPNSRLLIKSSGLASNMGRDYVQSHLHQQGIDPSRIELTGWTPTTNSHLQLYGRVDIALDTFPYNGTTTTCEALWMGVPVVTFAGSSHVSRVGAALLTNAGCSEWIANDVEGYIALAAKLAANITSMSDVRKNLREQMKASPLCDAHRLARELEQIYRDAR